MNHRQRSTPPRRLNSDGGTDKSDANVQLGFYESRDWLPTEEFASSAERPFRGVPI